MPNIALNRHVINLLSVSTSTRSIIIKSDASLKVDDPRRTVLSSNRSSSQNIHPLGLKLTKPQTPTKFFQCNFCGYILWSTSNTIEAAASDATISPASSVPGRLRSIK